MDAKEIARHIRELREAETEVQPTVGAVLGMDSAAEVFKEGLRRLGVDTAPLHPRDMAGVFRGARTAGKRPQIAMDSATTKSFAERFPNAARIRSVV